MPTATYTVVDPITGVETTETFEYEYPSPKMPNPIHIDESRWIDTAHTQAMARVGNHWLSYHPTDDSKTQYSIVDARTAGVLTGQIEPSEYVAPEPIPEPTEAELAEAELAERDTAGVDIRILEDVIDALVAKTNVQLNDLPEAARAKLAERKALRAKINGGA